jgi:hypothetical protein
MKKYFTYIVCLLLFGCSKKNDLQIVVSPPINSTPQPTPIVPPTPKNINAPVNGEIGGINYAFWNFNNPTFNKIVHTFTIYNEPKNIDSLTNDGLYYHNDGLYYQFYQGTLNDTIGFYYGIQTNILGNAKGIIFSRWNTRDTLNYKLANNGWGVSSGNEGDYIGVRIQYEWGVGTYSIELRKDSATIKGDWYGLWITNNSNKKSTYCGSMRFETSSKSSGIKDGGITWTELYYKANINTPLPTWHVSVDEVLADNKPPLHVLVDYNKNKFVGFSNIYTTNKKDVHFSMGPGVVTITPTGILW